MVVNSNVSLVNAEDNNETSTANNETFSSRFPVGTGSMFAMSSGGNSNTEEVGLEEGQSWVDIKDDWRHGKSGAASSSGSNKTGASKRGMAEGQYACEFNDGKYYWYHQSTSCGNCLNCGDWGHTTWGSGGQLSYDGCAMFSASMIVSNLTGQEVTPLKWLELLGCEVKHDQNYVATGPSKWLNDHAIATATTDLADFISETYGLENTGSLAGQDKSKMESNIKDVLDKGGMVWYKYSASGTNITQLQSVDSHYVCIRSYDANGYYILDSCGKPDSDLSTTPISFDTLYQYIYPGTDCVIGFYPSSNGVLSGVAGAIAGTAGAMNTLSGNNKAVNSDGTSSWYGKGTDINKYTDKIDLGDGFYLYNGLPWNATAKTVSVDTDTMLYDLFNWVASVSDTKVAEAEIYGKSDGTITANDILSNSYEGVRMHNESGTGPNKNDAKDIVWTYDCGGMYREIEGVKVVGVATLPTILHPNYNLGFGTYDAENKTNLWMQTPCTDSAESFYGRKKIAFALLEKATGKIWYLPATSADVKAHTFPGGLAQTSQRLMEGKTVLDNSNNIQSFSFYRAGVGATPAERDTANEHIGVKPKDLMTCMNTVDENGVTSWDATWSVAEFYQLPNAVNSLIHSYDYALVGAVVWHDDLLG